MEEKNVKNKRKIVIFVVILCLLIAIIGGLIYYFNYRDNNVSTEDESIIGTLNITLVDDSEKVLSMGSFNLYDEEGYLITTVEIGEDGNAKLEVNPGLYYFKQASGPEKYIMDDTMYKFTVDADNRTFNKTVTNIRYKGSLLIAVTDNNGNTIEGVDFNILDENGNLVQDLKTNGIGRAGMANIPFGKYVCKLIETPEGFKSDEGSFDFEIVEDNQVIRKDIVIEKQ